MIRRISYLLYILFTLAFVSSCNTMDDMLDEHKDAATLTVKIAQQDPTTVTRAISDAIENVNVLVFDAQGHLVGSAYASSNPTAVSVSARVSNGCTVCAIANTGSSSYFDGISTLTELQAKVTPALASADALGAKSNEILYGTIPDVTLSSGTNTQTVSLRRLYSKYTFTITPSSDIAITGYQLCNVPNECYIASGNTSNPSTGFSGLSFSSVATSGNAGTVVSAGPYYIYENLAGTSSASNTAELRTAANAPSGSSYLLITATSSLGLGAGWKSTYRVYLGGVTNATTPVLDYTNFNINRDFDYKCNISIVGSGMNDVRVTYTQNSTRTQLYYTGDATVGNYLYNDGSNGTTFKSGQTVGIIYSSELTQAQYNDGCRHGRALALKDAYSSTCQWSTGSTSPYPNQTVHPYCQIFSTSFQDVSSGYDASSSAYAGLTTNPAWYYCKNYNDGTTHSGDLAGKIWYLPSVGDWWDIMENLCTWTAAEKTTITSMRTSPNDITTLISGLSSGYYSNFDSKLTAAAGSALIHKNYYWSASEYSSIRAVIVAFSGSLVGVYYNVKAPSDYGSVRAVLAY